MVTSWYRVLQLSGRLLSIALVIGACNTSSSGLEGLPRREIVQPQVVQARLVDSTWRFDTISSPRRFQLTGQDWLAIDSTGTPALAYGGNQLTYIWFNGTTWQGEIVDPGPGAGKFAHLLFDKNDQPHIVYATGSTLDLTLDTMFRDSDGWHHQTIDPNFCFGRDLDAVPDSRGNPVVAYEASPSCKTSDYYQTQIRIAHQTESGWEVKIISEHGLDPFLTVDRAGKLHLGYLDAGRNVLVNMVYQPDGTWAEQNNVDVGFYPNLSGLLIDTGLWPHFIYCMSEMSGCMVYHSWLDQHGWQKEQVGLIAHTDSSLAILMDSKDRIYLLGAAEQPRILRRDDKDWQQIGVLDKESTYYPGLSLVFDKDEQIHSAYFKMPDYTIQYSTEQNGTWQSTVVDGGNEPYIVGAKAALVYDRRGQLHNAHYDARHNVHYMSQDPSGWQDEVVAQMQYHTSPETIELVFDTQNQPHIFFQSGQPPNKVRWLHAFQANGIWVNEAVPFDTQDEGNGRSPVTINPDGYLVFLEAGYQAALLRYRTSDTWQMQHLEDVQAEASPSPQIAFEAGTTSAPTNAGVLLPDMFYFDHKTHTLTFRSPHEKETWLVPILHSKGQPRAIAMRQTGPDSSLFVAVMESAFQYSAYRNGIWQVYELNDMYDPDLSDKLISPDGDVHLAYFDYKYYDLPLYYVEGHDAVWKKTLVTGYPYIPFEVLLIGTALNENGQFCLLLEDLMANSLVLGCLQEIQE